MAAVESEGRAAIGLLTMADSLESEGFLEKLYRSYPGTLLALFVLIALICSIQSSRKCEDTTKSTVRGPGGKPLPVTKRKRKHGSPRRISRAEILEIGPCAKFAFRSLAIIITILIFSNGIAIGIHTWKANPDLLAREGELIWWCGEPMVVSVIPPLGKL